MYTLKPNTGVSKCSPLARPFFVRDKARDAERAFKLLYKGLEHMLGKMKMPGYELSRADEDRLRHLLEDLIKARKELEKEKRRLKD